jgi:hypothetical protein
MTTPELNQISQPGGSLPVGGTSIVEDDDKLPEFGERGNPSDDRPGHINRHGEVQSDNAILP